MEDTDGLEFAGLPGPVQNSITAWVGAVRDADQKGADVLSVARGRKVARQHVVAIARKQLARHGKRTAGNLL